jgi:hypothetical protein
MASSLLFLSIRFLDKFRSKRSSPDSSTQFCVGFEVKLYISKLYNKNCCKYCTMLKKSGDCSKVYLPEEGF